MSENQRALLQRFVLRARIVQDHSLADDIDQLRKMSREQINAVLTKDLRTGETGVELKPVELIPTEQLESAAARVRPVFLKRDKVHYDQVLDAVATALKGHQGSSSLLGDVKELRKRFRQADPDYPHGQPQEAWEGGTLTNKQLSGAWLYGHLLHEDQVRRSYSGGMYPEEMFLAAMRTVCSEMLAVIETLHLIEKLQVRGWLDLPETIFTEEVTVKATSWVQPGKISLYVADPSVPLPDSLDIDLEAAGWRNAVDEFLPGGEPEGLTDSG
ncbi:hypothetical protein [Crystallibacter crystallopoietes]|uniref:hypothetical protein n=1 Tax=Crystallibacter crystallopoietes TaxID=37928 RepID=UPI00123753D8|nr:hypothetical protein [Arthrobacter crystallopoietes]